MTEYNIKYKGFSLIEALVALLVAAMTLVTVFAIYDRARRSSDSITQKLDQYVLPSEILQKMAEDLDKVAAPGSNAKIMIANSFQSGLPAAKLTIQSQILDKGQNAKTLEKVVWQTDFDMATGRLILYRSHSGLIWEDNLLDKAQRADWSADRELFVPLCTGISYFKIQVPEALDLSKRIADFSGRSNFQEPIEEKKFSDTWNQSQLPPAVTISLSFAAPIEGRGAGGVEVPDDQKIVRTIVIDRSRKMNFTYVSPFDANELAKAEDPNTEQKKTARDSEETNINSDGEQSSLDRPFSRTRRRGGVTR